MTFTISPANDNYYTSFGLITTQVNYDGMFLETIKFYTGNMDKFVMTYNSANSMWQPSPTEHEHSNIFILAGITDVGSGAIITVAERNLISSQSHIHDNKSILDEIIILNTAFNKNFGTISGTVSQGNHNHDTVYHPLIATLNTAFNKNFGTISGTVSQGNHNHDTVYHPLIATLNTAFNKNFGTISGTVSQGDHTHTDLHHHANKAIIDLIASAGSNHIIRDLERGFAYDVVTRLDNLHDVNIRQTWPNSVATGYVCDINQVFDSTYVTGFEGWKVFDGSLSTKWKSGSNFSNGVYTGSEVIGDNVYGESAPSFIQK